MLKHLHIQHFTLIDELDIDFHEGFSVITGETGSGKSILLGAIGLLLGARADSKSIQEGQAKCVIEAEFCLKGYRLETFFTDEGFDYDENSCIIRRELTAAGKSRAFINDSPASLAQLRELGSQLMDVHSQHQNMLLGQETYQLDTLDIIANNTETLARYATCYQEQKAIKARLDETIRLAEQGRTERDYMQFQYDQLAAFDPQEGEEDALEAERSELEHAEEIQTTLGQTSQALDGADESTLSTLNTARQLLSSLVRFYPKAEELASRAESAYIELKDIAAEVEDLADGIECSPARLQEVSDRLDHLYDLQRKHNVSTAAELKRIQNELEEKLAVIDNADADIAQLKQALATSQERAAKAATTLTERRTQAARQLEKECNATLLQLGMPNVRLEVELTTAEALRPSGQDCVRLLFAANKGGQLQDIAQVASGGEIARVMLALKNITSRHRALPTIVFDEIDTGVSGRIAEAMAHIMQQMAEVGGQVMAITHLPQIAALGTHHYKVYKDDDATGTHSHMATLSDDQRVDELAMMLSGEQITDAARANAQELLKKES